MIEVAEIIFIITDLCIASNTTKVISLYYTYPLMGLISMSVLFTPIRNHFLEISHNFSDSCKTIPFSLRVAADSCAR